ncbi:hypothetical protein ES708_08025 [subsurface metagenome]
MHLDIVLDDKSYLSPLAVRQSIPATYGYYLLLFRLTGASHIGTPLGWINLSVVSCFFVGYASLGILKAEVTSPQAEAVEEVKPPLFIVRSDGSNPQATPIP